MARTPTVRNTPTVRQFATLNDAAEIIGCNPRTLRRFIADGRLSGYRLGGGKAIRVDLDEVYATLRPIPTVRRGDDI
jgi:excisionase family DNA binding protein